MSDDDDDAWKRYQTGSVYRLRLKNFLTYSDLEIQPHESLNLIFGPNGTGKSSIICALCLGLGGSPKTLGRSTVLGDYVKRGETEARIEITLVDPASVNHFHVVTFEIKRNGTHRFTIDDQRANREEIKQFVSRYHIQVENLCQFMAQDQVTEFARQSAQMLLQNTEKAVGSSDLYERHMRLVKLRQEIDNVKKTISLKAGHQKTVKDHIANIMPAVEARLAWERKCKELEALQDKQRWLAFQDARNEFLQAKQTYENARRERDERMALLRPSDEVIKQARDECAQRKIEMNTTIATFENALTAFSSLNEKLEQVNSTTASLINEWDANEKEIPNTKTALEVMRLSVKKLERTLPTKPNDDTTMTEKLTELDAQHQTVVKEVAISRSQKVSLEQERLVTKAESESLGMECDHFINAEKFKLKFLQINFPVEYKAYMWYEKNKYRFKGTMFFPYMLIKLRCPEDAKFVEASLPRRDLFSFVFSKFEDLQTFLNVIEREMHLAVNAAVLPAEIIRPTAQLNDQLK